MKKLLLLGTAISLAMIGGASAADLYTKAPPPLNWTGCYVGANGGVGWGTDGSWLDAAGVSHGGQSFNGGLGGGQVGCDIQSGRLVFGAAGMFDWASLSGSVIDPANAAFTASTKVTMLDTATARLGYAVNRSLFYVDGGAAWSRTQRSFSPICATCVTATNSATGWTVGAGLEYMFAPNFSGKVEYAYAAFGAVTAAPDTANPYSVKQNINTVLVGINYRFGGLR